MIVSHKYKFIFLKTRKTAGTSIEIALSRFCGTRDIITPISDGDELIRQKLNFRGPQNYRMPLRSSSKSDWLKYFRNMKRKRFFNHAGARFIRSYIGEDIWNSYFKFCFERNPFDKAVSRYYWSTVEPRPEIGDFLASAPIHWLSNWHIYTIDDRIAVDFVGRYETLVGDLHTIVNKIGLPGLPSLPNAKGGYRVNREHYGKVFNDRARCLIERACAREMAAFVYRWVGLDE